MSIGRIHTLGENSCEGGVVCQSFADFACDTNDIGTSHTYSIEVNESGDSSMKRNSFQKNDETQIKTRNPTEFIRVMPSPWCTREEVVPTEKQYLEIEFQSSNNAGSEFFHLGSSTSSSQALSNTCDKCAKASWHTQGQIQAIPVLTEGPRSLKLIFISSVDQGGSEAYQTSPNSIEGIMRS